MAEPAPLTPDEVVAHLAGAELFELVDLAALRRLAALFRPVRYGPMQTLARQGETDATLWLVAEGMVALERMEPDGGARTVRLLGYGSALGRHGVFAGLPRETTAVTVDPTTLLCADREPLWEALRADPETLDRLMLPEPVRGRMDMAASGEAVAGEVSVGLFRRHWVYLARAFVWPLLLMLVALPLALFLAPALQSTVLLLGLALLGLGLPLLLFGWALLDWRMDYLRVTNRRIIHVDKMPLVSERRREVPLGRVQDIRVSTPNLLARTLGYGLVSVQTAGSGGDLTFRPVAEPEAIRELIMRQVDEAQQTVRAERQAEIARRLRATLGVTGAEALAPQADPALAAQTVDRTRPGPLAFVFLAVGHWLPRLRVEEGAVVTWRKHWWVLLRGAFLWWLAALALFAVFLASATGILPVVWWAGFPFWLAILGGLWWSYENWRNDFYQLTDSHIIDVEQLPLGLFRERRQANLQQIQDIHYAVPNPLAMLLNYGSVLIETAAETGNFSFDFVHDPAEVQREIFERIERARQRTQEQAEARQADEFARWIQQYHELAGGQPPPG